MRLNGSLTIPRIGHFLDGAPCSALGEVLTEVINPSTGEPCAYLPRGSKEDVRRSVVSARTAFEGGAWRDAPPSQRRAILSKFASLIDAEADVLDALDAEEMGKPLSERRFDARSAAALVEFYAHAADKVLGEVYSSDPHSFIAQRYGPRGVVGAITPWNFPTYNAVLKVAPALAAGNAVILKPSELASRSALRLAELATQAGLPRGVFNVVTGQGTVVGSTLALHDDVDMITFTGSTAVGKRILAYGGRSNMKVVVAECGGKSPHIVFDDGVDLEQIASSIADFLLSNQGQICSVGSRLIVQRSMEEPLVERIAARFASARIGDARSPETTFGPLASEAQLSRVLGYIDGARKDRAEVVMGGNRIRKDTGGFFVEPTIIRNVDATSTLAQEEVFGPVLAVTAFDEEADAVRLANGTKFGLFSYIWTVELSRGMRMAKAMRSSVLVNATVPLGEGAGHALSYEPMAQSGIGIEGGVAGLKSFMRRQLTWFNHA